MSENPYVGRHDEDGLSVFCPECYKADGWNEGYDQALEKMESKMKEYYGPEYFQSTVHEIIEALRKKVD